MTTISGAIFWIYKRILRLYPRTFYVTFASEMLDVFSLAIQDAAQGGLASLTRVFFRELGDLPVALLLVHIHERRKKMFQLIGFGVSRDVRLLRWITRALSLVFVIAAIAALVSPLLNAGMFTLPGGVLVVSAFCMLLAWRWEEVGGALTMLVSPFGLVAALLMASQVNADPLSHFPVTAAIGVGLAQSLSTLVEGWLFYSLGRHAVAAGIPAEGVDVRSKWRFVVYGLIIVIVLGLFAVVMFSGPVERITPVEPGTTPGVAVTVVAPAPPHDN